MMNQYVPPAIPPLPSCRTENPEWAGFQAASLLKKMMEGKINKNVKIIAGALKSRDFDIQLMLWPLKIKSLPHLAILLMKTVVSGKSELMK